MFVTDSPATPDLLMAFALGDDQVAETLARILARKHPGTVWTVPDSSGDASTAAVVVKLARPDDADSLSQRRMSAGSSMDDDGIDTSSDQLSPVSNV
jgi:hypothetical protein